MTEAEKDRNELKTVYHNSPSGRTIASFVLGIISIVLCPLPFMLIAAVVGLLLEKEGERTGFHQLQPAARILCIIGIILCSLCICAILVLIFVVGVLRNKP